MLNSKTVFILGAGASFEVGFPLGSELKQIISSNLSFTFDYTHKVSGTGDKRILQTLNQVGQNINSYLQACRKISDGIVWSDSIDDFINLHNNDDRIAACGKLAIAYSILKAEKLSKLNFDQTKANATIKYDSVKNSWYARFYSLLTKPEQGNNLNNIFDNITVINFNYDRSLEHFLINVISKNYLINNDEAKKIVDKLVIFRPYGSINKLVEFGSDSVIHLDSIVSNLKTYTEQVEDHEGLEQVHLAIEEADVLVFLGNAYHPNNMGLLQVKCDKLNKVIYATRCSISDHDIPIIRSRIINMLYSHKDGTTSKSTLRKLGDNNIFFADKCLDIFEQYRYSLSDL